ncbi:MAG: hypothetical protein J0L92_09395 [Deltaproteobacteria bacterium]|nr:hypothetical protein [Deltaproteobacteria bacterium]
MSADLGARLQRAGLVTREQLADTLATAPLHGSAFVRALVRRGVSEEALVGYFVAEGFGPLMEAADLASADPALLSKIPASVMREFAVLPVRAVEGSWIVAMLAPTERHVVAELERMAGARVIPAAARWSDLRAALADVGAAQTSEPAPEAPISEPPPVIELVRRRPSHAPADSGYRPASISEAPRRDQKLVLQALEALDAEDAVPLVRHKPVRGMSSAPPAEKIIAKSFAPPRETTPTKGLWARAKASTVPMDPDEPDERPRSSSGGTPAILPPTALELATAYAVDALPATAPFPLVRHATVHETQAVDARDVDARRDELEREASQVEPVLEATSEPDATHEAHAQDLAAQGMNAQAEDVPASDAETSTQPTKSLLVPRPSEPYQRPVTHAPAAAARPVITRTRTLAPPSAMSSPRPSGPAPLPKAVEPPPAVSVPEPTPTADESWSVPPAAPTKKPRSSATSANKITARATRDLVPMKAPLGDIRGVIVSIRQATDRDEVVRLALDGALSVSRSAVFFALRKGLLKGWDGIGSGVTEDSARNLWIPTSTASLFQKVVESSVGYFGPYGAAIADGLFRAAVGSRGGDLALLPVKVSGKVVGLLACDDVRAGPQGHQRLELLATAIEEAFSRIIVKQKQG